MFAGLRSDTYAMQRAGWRIAMEAGEAKLPRPPISGKAVTLTPSPALVD